MKKQTLEDTKRFAINQEGEKEEEEDESSFESDSREPLLDKEANPKEKQTGL